MPPRPTPAPDECTEALTAVLASLRVALTQIDHYLALCPTQPPAEDCRGSRWVLETLAGLIESQLP